MRYPGINTLRQRLSALSRWHSDQGFPAPTKSPLVRRVLKGIRSVHTTAEKRARPLKLHVVQQINRWLDAAISHAQRSADQLALLRHTRNRSLLLQGFWRGFRSDELVNLRVKNIQASPGEGLACYWAAAKATGRCRAESTNAPRCAPVSP